MSRALRTALFALLGSGLAVAPVLAQGKPTRPRTTREALARLEQNAGRPEAERRQAVTWLGAFDAPEVTAALLEQLDQAAGMDFQRVVIRAIGKHRRDGVLEPLMGFLDLSGTANTTLMNAAADAVARQGAPGVARLGEILDNALDSRQYTLRSAALQGLGKSKLPAARRFIVRTAEKSDNATRAAALRLLAKVDDDPAVTEVRLKAAAAQYETLAAEAVAQLAKHDHLRTEELALTLSKRTENSRSAATHMTLVEVLAARLSPPTFEAVLIHAAAAGPLRGRTQAALADAHRHEGFVRWLLRHGLQRKSTTERAIAVRLLAKAEGDAVTRALLPMVRAEEPPVANAAIAALAQRGGPDAVRTLRRLLRARSEARRIEALMGLHLLLGTDPDWPKELQKLLSDRDPGVRTLALDLLAEAGVEAALPRVYRDLDHKSWTVRAAALDFLRKVRRVESIPKLIARLDKESGRLRQDLLDTLQSLTNCRFWEAAQWRKWWKVNQEGFQLPPVIEQPVASKRTGGNTISYYNIPLISDRVIFVLDTSGSMSAPMGTGGNRTRLDEAKRQLHRVLDGIPADFRFNLVFFQSSAKVHGDRLVPAKEKHKEVARQAVNELKTGGGTNVHDAMEQAFNDPDVDTIYLLTDGQPSAGPIVDQNELADEIARWNRARRIRIHAIAVGSKSTLLERLAKESGGQYVFVR